MRRRLHRRSGRWPRLLALLLILALIAAFYLYQRHEYFLNTPVNPESTEEITFTVKKGDNTKTIAENLYQKGLLLDRDSFVWNSRWSGRDKEIKSGIFSLQQSQNARAILDTITSNKTRQAVVTIPEGYTVQETDTLLSGLELGESGDYIKAVMAFDDYEKHTFLNRATQKQLIHPLEGYLFPDTYHLNATTYTPENLISQQLNTFAKKALPVVTANTSRSAADIVNVAAMVEKETNRQEDRPIVAGIIWKRLDSSWVLGIDATLLYLKEDREIDYRDLQEDTPYNTRQKQGLPPGPIANPGLASLKAAANPEETPYFFYLTGRDGQTFYAVSNEEHNANKAKYL